MMDNGTFRKKNGFTITGNTLTRDKKLSLKAKGLYLLISSYITFEDITLTKSFIFSMCVEKEKAFEHDLNGERNCTLFSMPRVGRPWYNCV